MANGDTSLVNRGALWTLLSDMKIEEPGAVRSFAEVLAAEQDWPLEYAERVESEYRRFLYLAATSDEEMTPSRAIDKAWHLHLTYTRHYWDVLCREILGRPLHHIPGTGSEGEDERYVQQYLETLERYRSRFEKVPPEDIWPRPNPPSDEGLPVPGKWKLRPILAGIASLAVGILSLALDAPIVGIILLALGVAFLTIPIIPSEADADSKGKQSGCGGGGCGGLIGGDSSGDGGSGSSCGGGGCGGGCGG